MVRYIEKKSNDSESSGRKPKNLTNKSIINKAIQQEMQKNKETTLPSESENLLNKEEIFEKYNSRLSENTIRINNLKKENQLLTEKLALLSNKKNDLNGEVNLLKTKIQTLEKKLAVYAADTPQQERNISLFEDKISQLNELIEEKDAQIINLADNRHKNFFHPSLIKNNIGKILCILIVALSSPLIFYEGMPPYFESIFKIKVKEDLPLLTDDKNISDNKTSILQQHIELLSSSTVFRRAIENNEQLPIDNELREEKIEEILNRYKKRIKIQYDNVKKLIKVQVIAKSPEKSASILNDLVNNYFLKVDSMTKKIKLQALLKAENSNLKIVANQIRKQKQIFSTIEKKKNFHLITSSTAKNLRQQPKRKFIKLNTKLSSLNFQIKKLMNSMDVSDINHNFYFEKDLHQSPVILNLIGQLKNKEFNRFLFLINHSRTHPFIQEQEKSISKLKAKIVEMIKIYINKPFTPDEEADLTLSIMLVFLESKTESLENIINKNYIHDEELPTIQGQYLKNKKILEDLEKKYDAVLKEKNNIEKSLIDLSNKEINYFSLITPPHQIISKKTKILYVIFCLFGLSIGIALAFILGDYMDFKNQRR